MTDKRFSPKIQFHYKRNFSDVVESFIPKYYVIEDQKEFGETSDIVDVALEFHLKLAENIGSVLTLPTGSVFTGLNSFEGIAPFFDKNNSFSDIDKFKFERQILYPNNYSFRDFSNKTLFRSYLETTLIPALEAEADPATIDSYINSLGWFYLLAQGSAETIQPSSIVVDYLVDKLYADEPLTLVDGVNALTDYAWKNELTYIPPEFTSGAGEYVSGTQQLEKLKTINEILFSTSYLNRTDTYVADAFEPYSLTRDFTKNVVSNGAFWRLIKSFSFTFADQQDETNKLQTLYDLQDCPDEYLPEIANLIGWKLLGYDRNKWRLQLANAVSVYKRAGTKQSIQVALNNLFGDGGIDLDSYIQELWESYIPYLIFYALATESQHFINFSTFTPTIAESLGIDNYDHKNFENNIRSGVDKILLNLYERFPSLFKLANEPFPQDSDNFIFKYRGKIHPIPPFEEIPYYITSEVTPAFLDVLEDLLVCFGVRPGFAAETVQYIRSNTIDNLSDVALDNSWLIFTPSLELPPNWDAMVANPSKDKSKYLSLWNGKSSHFKLDFSGGSFDFNKIQFTPDSKYAILMASRVAQEFSPAHAIPIVKAYLEDSSNYEPTGRLFNIIESDPQDYPDFSNNYRNKAIDILQGLQEFSGLGRERISSLFSPSAGTQSIYYGPTFNTTNILQENVERNSLRRRNYKNALNLFGYYDRTGFNPPIFRLDKIPDVLTAAEDSELITRGLIPSSLEFDQVSALCSDLLSGIPDIYKLCIPNKNRLFYGYYLSSTIPTRGISNYFTDLQGSSMYEERGQFDPFMYLIYRIEQRKLEAEAHKQALADPVTYSKNSYWLNVSASEANKKLSCQQTALSSINGYYDYSFGQDIHKLYQEYLTTFNGHPLTTQKYSETTTDILRHCFGSILKNSDFEDRGSQGQPFYASSSDSVVSLTLRSDPFTAANFSTYGTQAVTSSPFLLAKSTNQQNIGEYVNSNIIDGVDIIHTSGASVSNEFAILDLQSFGEETYVRDNAFIKMRSVNGLPRLRFHVSGSDFSDQADTFRATSFLSPNHKFKVTLKGLAALNDGTNLADAEVGIWIHTKKDATGQTWHYTPDGEWVKLTQQQTTIPTIVNDICHKVSFDAQGGITQFDSLGATIFRCAKTNDDPESETGPSLDPVVLFDEKYFSEVSVEFDTFIGCGISQTSALHNPEQHYIVEVFMIPKRENANKFILLDNISLRDETLWGYSKIQLAGDPIPPLNIRYCDTIDMDLSEEDIRIILQSFSRFAGRNRLTGFLSRNSSKSSYAHLTSGGARDSYRDTSAVFNYSQFASDYDPGSLVQPIYTGDQITLIDFRDPTSEEIAEGFYASNETVAEAVETVPVEGEDPFENVPFGFWIG